MKRLSSLVLLDQVQASVFHDLRPVASGPILTTAGRNTTAFGRLSLQLEGRLPEVVNSTPLTPLNVSLLCCAIQEIQYPGQHLCSWGWQDDYMGKGACGQASQPEFESWVPHGRNYPL